MGGICVKPKAKVGGSGSRDKYIPQVLMLGPFGSGKTTLLYKTIMPDWVDAEKRIDPTVSYHYEEIMKGPLQIGIWDVSGSEFSQELWQMYYQMVKMDVVIFVMSLLDLDSTTILTGRRSLNFLIHEDELRDSLFCIVLNTMNSYGSPTMKPPSDMLEELGVSDLVREYPERIQTFVVNAKDGEKDPEWKNGLKAIVKHCCIEFK